jgi:predicted nucleotidyltransferase
MKVNKEIREALKREIFDCLHAENEILKIIVFGSFLRSENPGDIDVAIFQDSSESYLSLAMKYRKLTRNIARKIPLDVIPLKSNLGDSWFLSEINAGEVLYEK